MKEKTYLRMTKKRPLRGLKRFKQKYLTLPRFYALLASLKLVREVKRYTNIPHNSYTDDCFNGEVKIDEPIVTERGRFTVSHLASISVVEEHHWYESLFKRNRLYTVCDRYYFEVRVAVQAECDSFLVKVNPFTSVVVHRNYPKVYVTDPISHFTSEVDMAKSVMLPCNFLNARMKISMENRVSDFKDAPLVVSELLEITRGRLKDYIEGNPEEINERLTGVKYDGEFHTKEGDRLLPNNLCHKCGLPVFETSTEGYTAQCVHCYEDLYSIEIDKVDPKYYEIVYEQCKELLYEILSE